MVPRPEKSEEEGVQSCDGGAYGKLIKITQLKNRWQRGNREIPLVERDLKEDQ